MKHVFVETNFLVDLLRPFPKRDAGKLFARNGVDVQLHVPWVSVSEAKRTITSKIVDDDLGFAGNVKQFGVALLKTNKIAKPDMAPIEALADHIRTARATALQSVETEVDNAVSKMIVIPPSQGVVNKTIALYPIKSLPPFDEMVLGAVLFQAQSLSAAGEKDLYFCNANFRDFRPTSGNNLGVAYATCNLNYLDTFEVP